MANHEDTTHDTVPLAEISTSHSPAPAAAVSTFQPEAPQHTTQKEQRVMAPRKELGNPGPLGLSAFGMTTMLLNFRNAHAISVAGSMPMVFAMGAFFGGLAQIIAGVLEFIRGNTLTFVAFTGYGCFWESFVFLNFFATLKLGAPNDACSIAMYLFIWGLFSLGMACATIKNRANRCTQALFFLVVILFMLLALSELVGKTGHEKACTVINQIAGVEGIIAGALALYMAMAEMNEWPLFPMPKKERHEV